jgi:hypothetical protein
MDSHAEREAKREYVTSVYYEMIANSRALERLLILPPALALIIVALSSERVAPAVELALRAPTWPLALGGCWAIALAAWHTHRLLWQRREIVLRLKDPFQSLQREDKLPPFPRSPRSSLAVGLVQLALEPRKRYVGLPGRADVRWLFLVIEGVVPVLAQVVATRRMLAVGLRWQALACVLALLTTVAFIVGIMLLERVAGWPGTEEASEP